MGPINVQEASGNEAVLLLLMLQRRYPEAVSMEKIVVSEAHQRHEAANGDKYNCHAGKLRIVRNSYDVNSCLFLTFGVLKIIQ